MEPSNLRDAHLHLIAHGAEASAVDLSAVRSVAEALERRRTDAQHRLAQLLNGLCIDHILRPPEDDTEMVRADCLLPAGSELTLASEVEAAAAALGFAGSEEPVVHLVGPAPPFNFVSLALQPASAVAPDAV